MANIDELLNNQTFVDEVLGANDESDIQAIREKYDIGTVQGDELDDNELDEIVGGSSLYCNTVGRLVGNCQYKCRCGAKYATAGGLERHVARANLRSVFGKPQYGGLKHYPA